MKRHVCVVVLGFIFPTFQTANGILWCATEVAPMQKCMSACGISVLLNHKFVVNTCRVVIRSAWEVLLMKDKPEGTYTCSTHTNTQKMPQLKNGTWICRDGNCAMFAADSQSGIVSSPDMETTPFPSTPPFAITAIKARETEPLVSGADWDNQNNVLVLCSSSFVSSSSFIWYISPYPLLCWLSWKIAHCLEIMSFPPALPLWLLVAFFRCRATHLFVLLWRSLKGWIHRRPLEVMNPSRTANFSLFLFCALGELWGNVL